MSEQMHVRIVPMTGDHLDEVAELERICFTTPWSPGEKQMHRQIKNRHALTGSGIC